MKVIYSDGVDINIAKPIDEGYQLLLSDKDMQGISFKKFMAI
ncbi:hypothetical protein [Klebsiella aerogenes]|nr:hypothetical protein [Klebsiella aerogenes]